MRVAVGVGVLVEVGVGVLVAVRVGVLVAVRVGVLVAVGAGVIVGPVPLVVNRRSSKTWSLVLERRVKLVTGFTHPVTRVWGLLPDVVILASGLPTLLSVKTLLAPELTLTLRMITGCGKLIVPCRPLLGM